MTSVYYVRLITIQYKFAEKCVIFILKFQKNVKNNIETSEKM